MLRLSATLTEAVFVYLCICICVFARQTPGNIVFEVLVSLPFRKYMVCMVQNLAQWRNDEVKILQFQVQVQVKILHFDQHFILVG